MTPKINIFRSSLYYLKPHVVTHFRFVSIMNSPYIRKFCCDTCHWTQQFPIRYNLGRDKKILITIEIGFRKQKSLSQHHVKVVMTLFLLPFTLVSKFIVAIRKTVSRHHNSVSFVETELLMLQPNFVMNCLDH